MKQNTSSLKRVFSILIACQIVMPLTSVQAQVRGYNPKDYPNCLEALRNLGDIKVVKHQVKKRDNFKKKALLVTMLEGWRQRGLQHKSQNLYKEQIDLLEDLRDFSAENARQSWALTSVLGHEAVQERFEGNWERAYMALSYLNVTGKLCEGFAVDNTGTVKVPPPSMIEIIGQLATFSYEFELNFAKRPVAKDKDKKKGPKVVRQAPVPVQVKADDFYDKPLEPCVVKVVEKEIVKPVEVDLLDLFFGNNAKPAQVAQVQDVDGNPFDESPVLVTRKLDKKPVVVQSEKPANIPAAPAQKINPFEQIDAWDYFNSKQETPVADVQVSKVAEKTVGIWTKIAYEAKAEQKRRAALKQAKAPAQGK